MKTFQALLIACLVCATPLLAQDAGETEPAADVSNGPETGTGGISTLDAVFMFLDSAEWQDLATRVETALGGRVAPNTVLNNLRGELVTWRETFLSRQSLNGARIATVSAQIAALGPVPETGEEDPRVATRRANLNDQLRSLQVPVVLATEAFAQANGLIGEIDTIVRDRQAEQFTERSQSPLNPTLWASTWTTVSGTISTIRAELRASMNSATRRAGLFDVLPAVLALLAVAVVGLLRGRVWFERFADMIVSRTRRGRGVTQFVLSIGQIVIPLVGLLAFTSALQLTGMTGRRLGALLDSLPRLGMFPILAHWIAGLLLPKNMEQRGLTQDQHDLNLAPAASARAHRRFVLLGYALMLFGLMQAFVTVNTIDTVPTAVLMFPVGFLLCWTLYWFGRVLHKNTRDTDIETTGSFRTTLRGLLSRGLMIAALGGLLFAALGYANAFAVIPFPAAMTVYVVGILVLLQRLAVDGYTLVSKSDSAAQTALMPVVLGFVLILVSLPILAIVWGAQVTDLTELWARFREGFAIGETRVSPTSFLLFAVVFVVGYTVTRLVQGALRTTVLPRTKMDAGGQNAIVSGMGYVGIFLAAVVAITTAGIDLSGLAIVAGALSVGIGFGLQNIVSNFVSGIILLIERPISQGDWIEVGGQMGYVRDISVRSTRIETFDRTDVIVPNADLVSNQVTNWTRGNSVGRVIVPVGVAYGTNTEWVTQMLREIAEAHPMVLLNPPPAVVFQGFGADSLDFEIRAILRDVNFVLSVKSDMNHAIAKKFTQEGVEIPFGQRDIWLRNPETLRAMMQGHAPEASKAGEPGS